MQQLRSVRTAVVTGATLIVLVPFALGQAGQEKLAALKQSAAQNKQRLMQYQWTETQQITLKGEPKGTKEFLCRYGPDGQVAKTPIGVSDSQPPQGGRLKQRVVQKKKEEMQDYMGDVKSVLALYLPPDPQKMQRAFQSGNASFTPAEGMLNIAFKNYAQPGDQMTVAFNQQEKKISHIDVNTYTQSPDQVVTLAVQMGSLPDGTNYTEQTILNAKTKNLVVTTTNTNYQKLGN